METYILSMTKVPTAKLQQLIEAINKELPKCTDAKFSSFVQARVIRTLADWINENQRNGITLN